ncbi:MAG: hypothetical protein PHI12_13530, partial [Dehalococcoidales bacterium]|nr:hypothetical protein [Dehalococcoidales bacterium]
VSGQTDLRGSVLNTTGNFTISDSVDMSGDLSLTGNSANVVFSGTGDHLLSVTSGTLKLGTSTLAGDITGAGYQISDLGRLTVDNLILDGNTLNTASGNLVLDSNSGTTQISDSLIVTGLLEVQGNFASSSFAGQVELFGTPDGTAVDQGSLYVNPATAGVNNTLLGVAVSDVQKMRFDAEGDMEISGTFSSTGGGTSQFSGGLSVLGSLTLGDEISDIIDVKGRFSSSLVPSEDAAYTLGLPDYRWSNFYVATATIDNLIAGGSASSTFIINTDNASADAEDSQLEFERGSAAPNAVFKWNSTDDRFEFNDFSVYMANSLNVAGDETSSFAGPSLFTGTPLGTGVGQGSLYINPSSGLSDYTVFSVAVNDNERFRVDAEGDTTVQGSLGIENYIYDITQDTLLIDDDLQVGGGDIKDAGGNIRITLGGTNTITGSLAVSTGYITGANSEQLLLGVTNDKVEVVRGGSTYTVCDASGNCQSADGGYVGGLGNANYLSKFTGSYSVGDSIVYDNGSQVGIGTSTPSRKLTVEGKIYATSQGTAAGEVITAGRILTAGTGLSGGGDLTQDRTFSVDYGSAAGTAVEGDTQVTVTAGDAITGGGTITLGAGGTVTLNHEDTSTQASVNNSDGTVIQDITLDTYGHLTAITSYNLDGRYYTETESDNRFLNVAGDSMAGTLDMANNLITNIGAAGTDFTAGGGLNIATNLSVISTTTSGTLNVGSGNLYVSENGRVGIGTDSPDTLLTLANDGWISGKDSAGTGSVNIAKINSADQIQMGGALNIDGGLIFPADGGMITAMDMPFTSAGLDGDENAYVFRIGTSNVLSVYGQNDGSGNLKPGTGRIGIGTTTPQYALDVAGNANIGTSSDSELLVGGGYGKITVGTIDPPAGDLKIEVAAGSLSATASDDIYFATNNTERMRILSSGYVGIGTSTPEAKLEIAYDTNGSLKLGDGNKAITGGNSVGNMHIDSTAALFLNYYSNQNIYTGTGNVGIGTETPGSYKLNVQGKIYASTQGTAAGEVITAGRTITAGTGLSGGGDLTQDRSFSVDYGSTAGTAVEGDTQVTVTAGNAITGGGTITLGAGGTVTLNHEDTSTQSSVNNSDGTVIQDITLDTYGHLTAITSYNLDGRYYTETESDNRFLNVAGDSMSGNLTMTGTGANIILGSNYLSGDGGDEGVSIDSSGNVTASADLTVVGGDINVGSKWKIQSQDSANFRFLPQTTGTTYFDFTFDSQSSDPTLLIDASYNYPAAPYAVDSPTIKLRGHYDDGAGSSGYKEFRIKTDITANDGSTYLVSFEHSGASPFMVSDQSGNIGIGDTTPASLLTVGANDVFQVNSSGDIVKIKNVTYSWPSSQGAVDTFLQNDGSGNLSWTASGGLPSGIEGQTIRHDGDTWVATSTLFVASSGNVGIGTSNPSEATLEVISGGNAQFLAGLNTSDNIFIRDGAINGDFSSNAEDTMHLNWYGYQGGTTQFRNLNIGNGKASSVVWIDGPDSRVGIGTTNPESKLHVSGNILFENNNIIKFKESGGTQRSLVALDASNQQVFGDIAGGTLYLNTAGSIYMSAGGSTKMMVKSDGNVGIGTTNPGQALEVNGNIYANGASNPYIMSEDDSGVRTYLQSSGSGYGIMGTNSNHPLYLYTNGNSKVAIDATGNVGIGLTNPTQGKLH